MHDTRTRQRARKRIGDRFLTEGWEARMRALAHQDKKAQSVGRRNDWMTDDQVREIRRRVEDGEDAATIAADIGRSESSVTCAARGETYTHVPDEPELVCPECEREFEQRGGLGSHTKHAHGFILATCGTYAGYARHIRRDEKACKPCREANAAYKRRLRS